MRVMLACALVAAGLGCGADDQLVTGGGTPSHGAPEAPDEEHPVTDPSAVPEPIPVGPSGAVPGLLEDAVQASLDEGGNLWVASRAALYVMRAGTSSFLRFTRETGLRNWPLLSVEGGAPGQAFVGYEGIFGPDPYTDPEWVKRSGDTDRVQLKPDDTLSLHRFDLHNSNDWNWDETRIIHRLVYVHDGPRKGELYVGSGHGATRVIGNDYADHRHPETKVPNANGTFSMRYGEMHGLALTPEGDLLLGNKYRLGRANATADLKSWWSAPWIWDSKGWPVDDTAQLRTSGIAITPDGTAYFGSYGLGVVVLPPTGGLVFTVLAVPNLLVTDIVADPDGTVWIGSESGLDRYDPASGDFTRYALAQGAVQHLDLDATTVPRTLVVTAGGDVSLYAGP